MERDLGLGFAQVLTAAVLARDEAATIERCLNALAWADERLVVVDESTIDDTAARASATGARVMTRRLDNFASQRNAALERAQGDWVLFVDADELVSGALAQEVRRAIDQPGDLAGFWIPRQNYICGRWIRHAGWYPDHQLRLLKRGYARYDAAQLVHEIVILNGEAGRLGEPLIHHNYSNLGQFRRKQTRYAALEAQAMHQRGVRPRPWSAVIQPLRELNRRYVTLEGYREGLLGLQLCALLAWSTWQTYRQLDRLWRES